ncbi:MAG: hypothetical protein ACTS6P_00560 [Candidatus Hodgkinia cicadicola]
MCLFMKILTTAKVVIDPEVQPKVLSGKRVMKGFRRIVDVVDDINIQALIEGLSNVDVSVVSISSTADKSVLAKLIAMGAKEMIHFCCQNELIVRLDCLAKAKLLKNLILSRGFNLVALGIQSSDTSSAQLGPMLAGLLNWPCITGVKMIKQTSEKTFVVKYSVKNVLIEINVPFPCVLTCDLSVKTPRLITVVDLLKAKRKRVNIIPVLESNYNLKPQIEIIEDIVSASPRIGKVFTNFGDAWEDITRWLKNRKWL